MARVAVALARARHRYSFADYLLSSSSVELVHRDGADWVRTSFGAGTVIELEAIRASLAVDDVMPAARSA